MKQRPLLHVGLILAEKYPLYLPDVYLLCHHPVSFDTGVGFQFRTGCFRL